MRAFACTLLIVSLWVSAADFASAGHFDARRAMRGIQAQCAFGPRVPGTEAHAQCGDWIARQLEALGYRVWEQEFETTLPVLDDAATITGRNIWGLPDRPEFTAFLDTQTTGSAAGRGSDEREPAPFYVLSAHWDTRPVADRERGYLRSRAVLGANDGASGVAVALEVARALKDTPVGDRLVLVFFDVEDAGVQGSDESWAKGARHAAANPPPWLGRMAAGINLDMVGGRDLLEPGRGFPPEGHSLELAPEVVEALWSVGRDFAPGLFLEGPPVTIIDDHLPFLERGLPWINLIGWPYEHWHTTDDTPDAISPVVLAQVGLVLTTLLEGWVEQDAAGIQASNRIQTPEKN